MTLLSGQTATAGRIGGPAYKVSTAPAHESVFYSVSFAAGAPGVVTVVGSGNTSLELYVYDADGHVVVGKGSSDEKTAVVNVYRTGLFRIEVRNIGPSMNSFVLRTN
jgi:hypothetical protein